MAIFSARPEGNAIKPNPASETKREGGCNPVAGVLFKMRIFARRQNVTDGIANPVRH
jgi:hypothetical protein